MKYLKKIYCFLFRHDFVKIFYQDNGKSQMREYKCVRCGYVEDSQYDYN